ncbi:hypothetical protein JXA84_02140 [candidate division WOR-3 bacterium]|nr:hypothetical protein [candidate division WOR-3 bacterium]
MKIMIKFGLFSVFTLAAVLSCSKNDQESFEIRHYEPKEPMYVVPETLYVMTDSFVQLSFGSTDFYGDFMAVLDISLCQCFVYENYELKTVFGGKGEGPGEFNFMQSGFVKFTKEGEIAIFDPMNSRLQIFNLEGVLLNSVQIGVISITFDIIDTLAVFAPLMGKSLMEFCDISTGELVKKFEGETEVDLMEAKLPPPMKVLAAGKGDTIWWGFTEEYTIYKYTMEDSAIGGFSVSYEPLPFPQEAIDLIFERAGQYKEYLEDKIRETQPPFYFVSYDREKERLLVLAASDEYAYSTIDVFDDQGNYLKRVKLGFGENSQLLGINGGIATVFDMDSLKLTLFDVSKMYE